MKYTIYYSIRNGGDGSANVVFMESKKLAQWDQDHLGEEGWGESCDGSISIESDSPIKFDKEVRTKESYLIDLIKYGDEFVSEFVNEFFPEGAPTFSVIERKYDKNYSYNDVYIGDKLISTHFAQKERSGQVFADSINKTKS